MAGCLTDADVDKLLDTMTRSGAQELEPIQMRQLKNYCRQSEQNIERVFRHLFHDLNQKHSQIRVTTLLIIGDLFGRSHRFRQLMTENLYQFFELCLEMNPKRKLPKPKNFAQKLKQIALDLIEKWDKEFGEGYEELRTAVKYLKDNRLIDFNERTVKNESQRRREDEKLKRRQNVLKTKIEKCVEQLNDIEVEINTLLTQIDSCFDLLMPKMTESGGQNIDSDRSADRVRHLNDFSVEILLKPFVEIVDNEDTNPIIMNLRELQSELSKILDTKLRHLIHIMSKGSDLCESDLKRGIDVKCKIEGIKQKFLELKIMKNEDTKDKDLERDSSDDSDDFEEVEEKEDFELFIPELRHSEYGLEPLECKPSTSKAQSLTPSESDVESKVLLRCNALLPSGRLCPRRDRIKCPFHGQIVARDLNGVPIDEEHRKREEKLKAEAPPDWQNPQLLKEIKAATGMDLSLEKSRKRKKKSELVDIKELENTARKRLEKRIFKKSVRERVERDLDDIQHKNQRQYADQWNYSLQS